MDDDFEGRGCSVGTPGGGGLLALLLGLGLARRRRR
jgi:MYXO-CTERM domain-containing protein